MPHDRGDQLTTKKALEDPHDWSQWSDWIKLDVIQLPLIRGKRGAYVIATRSPLSRAGGTDVNGVLRVGESGNLGDRIESFIRCARGAYSSGHMAGVRFFRLRYSESFPVEALWVRWVNISSEGSPYAIEGAFLKNYSRAFKELPPLNYKYNWSNDK